MTQGSDDVYYTAHEAMSYLNISRNKLEKLVDDGELKKYRQRVSRIVLFKKSELDALKEIEPVEEEGENN